MNRLLGALAGIVLSAGAALAQSSPGLVYGQVPTPAQWNSYFAAKQDVLGYSPVNKAGDVMTGKFVTAAPTTTQAGLNLPAGAAPTSPVNGDMWSTTAGLFVRINGVTVGPLVSTATVSLVIGSTPITGGSTTRILYDNAGVLGEYTISGSGTAVAMATSPVFVTPTLGAAIGTSVALGGATIGSNALAVTGTSLFNSGVTMGAALTYGGVTLSNSVTGTTAMVLAASPTFTGSPVLSTASATSLRVNGCTIGSNALCATGTANISGAITLGGAITYGGVTLNNAVTGTGNMMLSTGPTATGASLTTIATLGLANSGFNTFLSATGTNTGNRTISLNPMDGDRTLTMSGNANFGGAFASLGLLTLPTVAQGDIWYGSATGTISGLAKDANATRYLSNTGTTNNPAWAQVNLANGVTGLLPYSNLATLSADFILGNFTGSTASPAGIAINNCSNALTYSTSTHTFGCNAVAGTGTVTNVATAGLATGGPITTTGTVTVTAATQSDQETGTSTTTAVTPAVQKYSTSAAKVVCSWDGTVVGTTSCKAGSLNVSAGGITRVTAGTYNVNLTTAFSSAEYTCTFGIARAGGANGFATTDFSVNGASLIRVLTVNTVFALTDMERVWMTCYGDE